MIVGFRESGCSPGDYNLSVGRHGYDNPTMELKSRGGNWVPWLLLMTYILYPGIEVLAGQHCSVYYFLV